MSRMSSGNKVVALAAAVALAALLTASGQRVEDLDPDRQNEVFREDNELMWCVLSEEELAKCQALAAAVEKDQLETDGEAFGSYFHPVKCKRYTTRDECMKVIDENVDTKPNIMAVDAGEVFVGGRYHSLVPILRETYDGGLDYHHSLAVVKRGSLPHVRTLADLRDTKACFPKVGSLAGWIIPVHKLITRNVMHIADCNNHVKSAIGFFGISCAVNSLRDRYNPLGDNPHHFCELCGSDTPGIRCTNRDPYAEYTGALRCLLEKGDIAFLNEKTVYHNSQNPDDFELLCPENGNSGPYAQQQQVPPDGEDIAYSAYNGYSEGDVLVRKPLDRFEECSWGVTPGNAIVVSSAMEMAERQSVQIFMQKVVQRYGQVDANVTSTLMMPKSQDPGPSAPAAAKTTPDRSPEYYPDDADPKGAEDEGAVAGLDLDDDDPYDYDEDVKDNEIDGTRTKEVPFRMFESAPRYGTLQNLLLSDFARNLKEIKPSQMSYKAFLGQIYGPSSITPQQAIEGVRQCRVGQMTLCVTSEAEMVKCIKMRTALNAQLLEPKMSCKRAHSPTGCMRFIRNGEADVAVMDAGDVYKAGHEYGLIPVMAEVYNLGTPHYYVVAVTKQRDNSSELIYLKKKRTCHTAIGQAAGWIIPMAWLISNERIRDYGCNSVRAAAEYFSKACAPGSHSSEFQIRDQEQYWEYSHLCDLCHGTAGHYCQPNHMEDYYGHTGAFRCLVEGGGNVAFVKHTTVWENCDGKRKEWWARNQLTSDFELLCRDGTRQPARNYKNCYLGKVNSNAVVVNPRINEGTLDSFINLFKYAQQFYGQKVPDEFSFSMFYSQPPYADLIFQDATQQLVVIPREERHYTQYLDREFLKAYSVVECKSGAPAFFPKFSNSVLLVGALTLFRRVWASSGVE